MAEEIVRNHDKVTGKNKTVTFLLPCKGRLPAGGFKVVYEYANGLADRGWLVRVVHPNTLTMEAIDAARTSFRLSVRQTLDYQLGRITGNYRPDHWFRVRPNVKLLWTKTLHPRYVSPSDVWVATAWYTAKWAATYSGARVYLIQHMETWDGPEDNVMATWKLPLRKVVISRWLEEIARNLGEASDYVPNGLDFRAFGMDVVPAERDPHTVAMLYHHLDWKGSADGLKAMHQAKVRVPGLRAQIFGVPSRPSDLPSWIEYHQNPPQNRLREIYNRASIFLSPSWAEGWPLPPAEALQCGAALAATNIGGHREYAHHNETALLSPPKDPDALASNVLRLLGDQPLRLRLAQQGQAYVQRFTWDRAVTGFESVLDKTLAQISGDDSVPESKPTTTLSESRSEHSNSI
jgi:glycosyltransferase involved in cell wall biosynthesis